jgi:hypothetical protein
VPKTQLSFSIIKKGREGDDLHISYCNLFLFLWRNHFSHFVGALHFPLFVCASFGLRFWARASVRSREEDFVAALLGLRVALFSVTIFLGSVLLSGALDFSSLGFFAGARDSLCPELSLIFIHLVCVPVWLCRLNLIFQLRPVRSAFDHRCSKCGSGL